MSGREVRESIYGCSSYSEFRMKLEIMGFASVPDRAVFNMCHVDDWKWEMFMSIIEDSVDDGEIELGWIDVNGWYESSWWKRRRVRIETRYE